ncbi:MAG: hypothetical protein ABH824_05045 [Nanoarchaeota archaeon]|nr:hypothetical protein [Nanoarchaeota archaeon]MBU1632468.1 hypothetical protein [Nanoarchaeota archaeon]MBU1876459.1 hypothetical protein [Nanoarchaeota archaeon]
MEEYRPRLVQVPIAQIRPTEYLINHDGFYSINCLFAKELKFKPIRGYYNGREFFPEDGNKRSLFLHEKGDETISARVYEMDWEFEDVEELAERARMFGVTKISDLSRRKLPGKEYGLVDEMCSKIRTSRDLDYFCDAFGISCFDEFICKVKMDNKSEIIKTCRRLFGVDSYSEAAERLVFGR